MGSNFAKIGICVWLSAQSANAESGFFDEKRCNRVVQEIIASTQASVLRTTELGRIHLKHADATEFVLYCGTLGLDAQLTADTARPNDQFFELVALTGQFALGGNRAALRKIAASCQKKSLLTEGNETELDASKGTIQCLSFEANGGGSHVSWFRRYGS